MRHALNQWVVQQRLYAIAEYGTAGLLQDTQHKCQWALLSTEMVLQLACGTKNAQASKTPV